MVSSLIDPLVLRNPPPTWLTNRTGSRPQNLKEEYALACDNLKAELQELQAKKDAVEAKYAMHVADVGWGRRRVPFRYACSVRKGAYLPTSLLYALR